MWSVFGSRWTVLCSEGFANISSCRQEMGLLAPYNSNVTSQAQPHSLQSPTCYWVDAAHFYAWDCSKHYFGHWSLFIGGLVAFVRSSANYPRAIRQVASFWLMVSEVLKMIGERGMWVGGAPHAHMQQNYGAALYPCRPGNRKSRREPMPIFPLRACP